ncbi:MAG: inositol monophosphatase [Flavobacteriales bacterium]|nr:inositol monophosphatase [Flavobacteriales bacterium]
MTPDQIIAPLCDTAKEAGAYLLNKQREVHTLTVETKSLNSFVTEADKTAEAMIVNRLRKIIPEAGFIAEEGTEDTRGERFNWVIDPLDGTTNFIHGLPCFCVSIALMDKEEVVAGVIYEPVLNECFHAIKNGPAVLNGKEIRVSDKVKTQDALLATGFPYYDYGKMEAYLKLLGHLMGSSRGIRRWGSAAIDLAYVACGRFDAFYEYGLQPWDVAAGALIVQQAGGTVSTFKGDDDYVFGKEILASNTGIHPEMKEAINRFFD